MFAKYSFIILSAGCLLLSYVNCDYKLDTPYYHGDNDQHTLKLVHVIFRHGDRTNIKTNVYPNDPHKNVTYYPTGFGQLTKKGKRAEYVLGKHLRNRYDEFLGRVYTPNIIDARSSDTNRTKMSLELVLAGLFPPVGDQIWDNSINWQPIPYNFYPKEMDKEFFGLQCLNYKRALADFKNSPQYLSKMSQYNSLLEYLTDQTGRPITDDIAIFRLYNGMVVEEENGLILPPWTRPVYPQPLKDISISTYYTEVATPTLKKLATGYLLRKIINDTLSKIENVPSLRNRKMYLYSGHEFNVAFFLITLGIFDPQIPPYGSHIMLELHEINGVYGFMVFFHDYKSENPPPLVIPGCQAFCPLDQFISLLEKYIPTDADCGGMEQRIS